MDQTVSFTFEDHSVRGVFVRLNESWAKVLETSLVEEGDERVRAILAEFVVCGLLLSSTLKLEGSLLVQVIGKGALSMLLVEIFVGSKDRDISFRAMAKTNPELLSKIEDVKISSLIQGGTMSLTIDPKKGSQAYQSIVTVTDDSVAQIFESYMMQSEQIDTRLFVSSENGVISGVLLQVIPEENRNASIASATKNFLDTISSTVASCGDVISHLSVSNDVIRSLFPEYDIRVYEDRAVAFTCTCSREKIASLLITLGQEESEHIIKEEGVIKASCEFCGQIFEFDSIDVTTLFTSSVIPDSGKWRN